MGASMMETIDKAVFLGDAGATGTDADIAGFTTAGITEATITQANKIKGDELLKLFLAYVDGQYAAGMGDVRVVASVRCATSGRGGSWTLSNWRRTSRGRLSRFGKFREGRVVRVAGQAQ